MDTLSSDGIEILSVTGLAPVRARPDRAMHSSNPPTPNTTSGGTSNFQTTRDYDSGFKATADVIELSDGSGDEVHLSPPRFPSSHRSRLVEVDDDDVVVVTGPSNSTTSKRWRTSSDDLLPLSDLLDEPTTKYTRSASLTTASTSNDPIRKRLPARANTLATIPDYEIVDPVATSSRFTNFSSSPAPRPFTNQAKGKRPQSAFEDHLDDLDDDLFVARVPTQKKSKTAEKDPWAAYLEDSDDGNKKKKGKAKAKGPVGKRQRSVHEDGSGTEEDVSAKTRKTTSDDKVSKKEQAANKRELKKQETQERIKLREANALRTKDKSLTAAELTVHFSGKAFDSLLESGSGTEADDNTRRNKKRKKGKKETPSPWLEISQEIEERMKFHNCRVERPESTRQDVGSEGAIRWTRICKTKWDDERNMFLPLPDGKTIIVEEDSRLVLLTALELSGHIARNTLTTHIANIQSQMPQHVNLFVLVFGVNALFRDLERVRQAEYRAGLRVQAGETPGPAIKPAGIGPGQPNRDEIELALMRMQVASRCMIINVETVEQAVDWIEQLTLDIGQKPYQRHKLSHLSILGTGEANLPCGKSMQDTYIKMLATMKGVTEPIAEGIASEYPTLRKLLSAWERCPGGENGRKNMLVGIGKGRNLNGTATHRAIGTTLSSNIHRMMTSRKFCITFLFKIRII
ncbi:uncharacterized protein JCM15063_001232 [Sporobolomyces koalae]|uniref:uncharacterized protein n=1 Tax=Sporobolomyces koalae TaxID=500713 RepID=UPI00317F2DB7